MALQQSYVIITLIYHLFNTGAIFHSSDSLKLSMHVQSRIQKQQISALFTPKQCSFLRGLLLYIDYAVSIVSQNDEETFPSSSQPGEVD